MRLAIIPVQKLKNRKDFLYIIIIIIIMSGIFYMRRSISRFITFKFSASALSSTEWYTRDYIILANERGIMTFLHGP